MFLKKTYKCNFFNSYSFHRDSSWSVLCSVVTKSSLYTWFHLTTVILTSQLFPLSLTLLAFLWQKRQVLRATCTSVSWPPLRSTCPGESRSRPTASLRATAWFMSPALQLMVRNSWNLTTLPLLDIPQLAFLTQWFTTSSLVTILFFWPALLKLML